MDSSTIAFIQERLSKYEEGTPEHAHYTQMLQEMKQVKLHVAEESLCTSCE